MATAKPKAPPKPKGPAKAPRSPAPWETETDTKPAVTADSTSPHALLTAWRAAVRELAEIAKPVIERERLLRQQVVDAYFAAQPEGTSRCAVGEEGELVLTYPYTRTIDEAALASVAARLPEGSVPYLVRYKPALELERYRTMPDELRAIFDEALITKPGSPVLKFNPPKGD